MISITIKKKLSLLFCFLLITICTNVYSLENEFFAFDNGVGRGTWTPIQQAKTLDELGYAGIGYSGTENLDARLSAFELRGLRIFNIYVVCNLNNDEPYGDDLKKAIQRLKGTDVMIWLTVQGQSNSDEKPVQVVREIADLASKSDLKVALYPHDGFYVADIEDALRITRQVGRHNLGVTFNLCHELMARNEPKFDALLENAISRLFVVSINGADHSGGWGKLIQPLGHGAFNLDAFLSKLESLDYTGPIGLQCYNVSGSTKKNLIHNIEQWHKILARHSKK